MDQLPDKKHCPICSLDLVIDEFGLCRARKDGRNLYCKSCIRQKVTQSRRALKEYKSSRKKLMVENGLLPERFGPSGSVCKLSPVDRVRNAIREGHQTQTEIAQRTKLGKDEIGDALANLLLWTKEIRTRFVDNTRIYFFADHQPKSAPIQRKPNVQSYYAVLMGLSERKRMAG
jgi:hypothetical protein